MTLFCHRTCTYLHGRADRFLVSVSNGQVAALSEWVIIKRLWFTLPTYQSIRGVTVSSATPASIGFSTIHLLHAADGSMHLLHNCHYCGITYLCPPHSIQLRSIALQNIGIDSPLTMRYRCNITMKQLSHYS